MRRLQWNCFFLGPKGPRDLRPLLVHVGKHASANGSVSLSAEEMQCIAEVMQLNERELLEELEKASQRGWLKPIEHIDGRLCTGLRTPNKLSKAP